MTQTGRGPAAYQRLWANPAEATEMWPKLDEAERAYVARVSVTALNAVIDAWEDGEDLDEKGIQFLAAMLTVDEERFSSIKLDLGGAMAFAAAVAAWVEKNLPA